VEGPFDLLLDYGALNDRPPTQRDAYTSNVLFGPRDRMSVGSSPSVSPTLSDNRAVTPAGNYETMNPLPRSVAVDGSPRIPSPARRGLGISLWQQ